MNRAEPPIWLSFVRIIPRRSLQPLDSSSAFEMTWDEMHNENLLNLTHLWELNVRCCACASFYSHPIEKFVTDKESGGAVAAAAAESAHADRRRTLDWIARARIEHITRLVHQTMLPIICHTIQNVCCVRGCTCSWFCSLLGGYTWYWVFRAHCATLSGILAYRCIVACC